MNTRVANMTPLPLSDERLETRMTLSMGRCVRLLNNNVTSFAVTGLIKRNNHYQ